MNLCFFYCCFALFDPHLQILFIAVAPQILPFDFGEESVNSGEFASVTCSVHKGDLPLNITWLHNNKPSGYKDDITISKAGKKVTTLTIDNVNGDHSGNYTCVAQNKAGEATYTAELFVNGKFTHMGLFVLTFLPSPSLTNH